MDIPMYKVASQKQGDGSYQVRVIHDINGNSTDVVFPAGAYTADLAEEYAEFKRRQVFSKYDFNTALTGEKAEPVSPPTFVGDVSTTNVPVIPTILEDASAATLPGTVGIEVAQPPIVDVVSDRLQGVDCSLCEDETPHTHETVQISGGEVQTNNEVKNE
jgi:hypothetical protein